MVRLTLSVEMQNLLGCVIGQHVSSEMPWTAVKMKQVQENLISENDKSELFAIKESLMVIYNNKNSLFILYQCTIKILNNLWIIILCYYNFILFLLEIFRYRNFSRLHILCWETKSVLHLYYRRCQKICRSDDCKE